MDVSAQSTGTRRAPIYLFADSQLLFWRREGRPLLQSAVLGTDAEPRAAYVGASNGDRSDFYAIFVGAMELLGIRDFALVRATFAERDRRFLEGATLVVLAGGDVQVGWRTFQSTGLEQVVRARCDAGATLVGVSAGAIQLGLAGYIAGTGLVNGLFDTFQFVPFLIGVHEEAADWRFLKQAVRLCGEATRGLGIPLGGGMVFHPDQTIESLGKPLCEFYLSGDTAMRLRA